MEEDVRKSHQSGFIEHLTKPIDLERLRSTIDRVINGVVDITVPAGESSGFRLQGSGKSIS